MIYDVIIIGGGVSGINTAMKLSAKNRDVLLLDDRNYWGGRIHSKKQPHYEMGAARYSNKHTLLKKLIDNYKLPSILLPQAIDYLYTNGKNTTFFFDVHKQLNIYFRNLILKSKQYPKTKLKQITLFQFMNMCNSIEISEEVVKRFGYYSEIKKMNAYDAINSFKQDFVDVQYYALQEGLSYLCEKMIADAEKNGCVCKNNSSVTSVERQNNHFLVKTTQNTYFAKKIVFAIKGTQLKDFIILKPIHKHIESLHSAELLRIYAKYPIRRDGVWFNKLGRITTNSFLRQIIPIDYNTGLIMISYTDGNDVSAFKDRNGNILKESKIKEKIHKELNRLFENKVPQPTYFKTHYWEVGAHHWKPRYDSASINKKMLNPIKNIFICGEAFSMKQAWIEGALETSEEAIQSIG